MRISIALFLAAITLASTSNTARAVTWVFSGHVDSRIGDGTAPGYYGAGAQIGDLITGIITFNENATSANLRSDSTTQSAVYEDIISYMRIGPAVITNGGIHPDPTVLNIYSNSGIEGDDGFTFGYTFGNYSALVFGVAYLAMGSVITTLTPSATPFDLSLFPVRVIKLENDGNGFYARLDSLSIAPVPLPPTWTMMILGLCGLGVMVRRRRGRPAQRRNSYLISLAAYFSGNSLVVRKVARGVSVAIVSAIITTISASASFASTYNWTWSEGGPTLYSGTLITGTNCGVGCEIVNSISGSFLGASITTLLAPGAFPPPPNGIPNDNELYPTSSPVLSFNGISFSLANGDDINIYWNSGAYISYCDGPSSTTACDPSARFTSGTFAVTSVNSTTPLPAALPLFATGLGALGLLGWRSKRKRKLAS